MPDSSTDSTIVGPDVPPTRSWRRPSTIAAIVLFAALAAFWVWIFVYQLQNKGEEDMLDRLDDLSWTAEADDTCRAYTERIAALPPAFESATASERADVIDVATDEVERMLADLRELTPVGDTNDARITAAWLDDYHQFLQDRRTFADALRVDPRARFLVTEKYGSHITKPIDRFARVNEMEACMSPGDV
ncbi:MAG: hypothetical protein JJE52_11170 [Acidimicrobiia bacterium]|nr:hypothetical protein [Acidimicrobiia bacterium]